MSELLTAAQMRAIEEAAIDSGRVTGLELMERAGRGVVDAILDEWPALGSGAHHAVILCGPGNNGGDGFVVARRLRDRGWEVEVFLFGDPAKLPPDARTNHEVWSGMGEIAPLSAEAAGQGRRPALLVDAMFGTGLSRAIPRDCANAFHAVLGRAPGGAGAEPCRTVAVDCPSGLDCDSGRFLLPEPVGEGRGGDNDPERHVISADLTLSFHRLKIGHVLGGRIEKVRVIDIGLGNEAPRTGSGAGEGAGKVVRLLDPGAAAGADRKGGLRAAGPGGEAAHKYDHGHALILSGGPGRTGAARLAARGALRIGAGLVTVACPNAALPEVAAHVTAVMCRAIDGAPGLREMLEDERLNALCLGPGLGLGADTQALVLAALAAGRATVLDADALTRFERNPETLFAALHPGCVLTPHAGEFRRLFPDIAGKLAGHPSRGPAFSKVDAAREAAARAGCTVLLKGPDTVIADKDGRCAINASLWERSAPWLATAGAGDVLAGFIAGLLARGFPPMRAAETAAWLHTECALVFGPGLIAEDLPEMLPRVLARGEI